MDVPPLRKPRGFFSFSPNLSKSRERTALMEEFLRQAGGSFSTVYGALNAAAEDNQGAADLKKADVLAHIMRLVGPDKTAA